MRPSALALALALALATSPAAAASFIVNNTDAPGEGLSDATPVAPVGGNTGTTRGQQRLQVVQHAAAIWGELLASDLIIKIEAHFDPMRCEMNSATLGFAGPTGIFAGFADVPIANTWYPSALGDSIAGMDLGPGSSDIQAQFNSSIDTGCFLGAPQGWYYGLDGNPTEGRQQLLLVALHELAHGLGISISTNMQTGAKLNDMDDVFSRLIEDHSTGKLFPQMSNAERLAALTRTGELHWIGAKVRAKGASLGGGHTGDHVHLYAPGMVQAGATAVHFDTSVTPNDLMQPFFNADATHDLTDAMFQDIGWTLLADAPTATPTGTPTLLPTATPTRTVPLPATATVAPHTATPTVVRTATLPPTQTLTTTRTPSPRPTTAASDPGDANCDGHLRVADVLSVIAALAAGGEPECAGVDANESGGVESGDVGAAVAALFRRSA